MKKHQIANLCTAAAAVLILLAGVLLAGHMQGWFAPSDDSGVSSASSVAAESVPSATPQSTAAPKPTAAPTAPATSQEPAESSVAPAATQTPVVAEKPAQTPTAAPKPTAAPTAAPTPTPAPTLTCTVHIQCTDAVAHLEQVKPEKQPYLPEDGWILYGATVQVAPGASVFDALVHACSQYGIALEYSWSPMYGSQYVEGIQHLYEFDGGPSSGWLYTVNGSSPGGGCSAYTLSGGESIVWYYSCG